MVKKKMVIVSFTSILALTAAAASAQEDLKLKPCYGFDCNILSVDQNTATSPQKLAAGKYILQSSSIDADLAARGLTAAPGVVTARDLANNCGTTYPPILEVKLASSNLQGTSRANAQNLKDQMCLPDGSCYNLPELLDPVTARAKANGSNLTIFSTCGNGTPVQLNYVRAR